MKPINGMLYINNNWVDTHEKKKSKSPYSFETLGEVSQATEKDISEAIKVSERSFKEFSQYSVYRRSKILLEFAFRLESNSEQLVNVIVQETGKPIKDAIAEVNSSVENFRWFASEIVKQNDEIIPSHDNIRIQVAKKIPIGVVALITPWNFPLNLITRKLAPALAAGNSVIIKPSSEASLVATILFKTLDLDNSDLPKGTLQLLHGNSSLISKMMMQSSIVRKISFTGSTNVGKLLMRESSDTVKRLSLELGGNAPFIVAESSSLALAVEGIISTKIRNTGQVCTCPNRVFVHRSIHEKFIEMVCDSSSKLRYGNPLKIDHDYGPLIKQSAVENVSRLVNDAVKKGAKIEFQDKLVDPVGYYFPFTILSGITSSMDIFNEEIFGPVISIIEFDNIEDFINDANNTQYGLAGYLYSNNIEEISLVQNSLEVGMVGVNNVTVSTIETPFGGVKESGFGRENGKYGLSEFQDIKLISLIL